MAGGAFDASAPAAGSVGFDAGGNSDFDAFSKPGAAGTAGAGAIISLTATVAHPGSGSGSPTALPTRLLAEPAPAYGSAAAWGTHLAGAAPKEAPPAAGNPFGGAAAAPLAPTAPAADASFSDFSPFN